LKEKMWHMNRIHSIINGIVPADQTAMKAALARWDTVAKPLNSLGLLEEAVTRIAGACGSPDVDIRKRAVVAMCADNGVVAEGVTQSGQEVTAIVTENMSRGVSSVCCMSRIAGADVVPVDIGVAVPVSGERILQRNVRRGTADFAVGPAMTREECERAILTGIGIVEELKEQGYRLLATGEMGIGNTTTSAALVSVFLDVEPETVTGRGAGLTSAGLSRKVDAIRRGILVNHPDRSDVLDVLSKVGGLDIAGLVGVFLGGALCHVPVLIDGIISSVAALAAVRLCPAAADYMLATHVSGEPAGQMVLDALGLKPFLHAGMCLGEGTGAVASMPLLDMAVSVYRDMSSFADIHIDAYEHLN